MAEITEQRQQAIDGLRALADFLESTPSVPTMGAQRMLLSLTTNPAVEAFAAEHGLSVRYDDEGNASADLKFGPLTYHAYGYVDFAEHLARRAEQQARSWAERKGLELRPVEAALCRNTSPYGRRCDLTSGHDGDHAMADGAGGHFGWPAEQVSA